MSLWIRKKSRKKLSKLSIIFRDGKDGGGDKDDSIGTPSGGRLANRSKSLPKKSCIKKFQLGLPDRPLVPPLRQYFLDAKSFAERFRCEFSAGHQAS